MSDMAPLELDVRHININDPHSHTLSPFTSVWNIGLYKVYEVL